MEGRKEATERERESSRWGPSCHPVEYFRVNAGRAVASGLQLDCVNVGRSGRWRENIALMTAVGLGLFMQGPSKVRL